VPGDVILLEEGERLCADARLIEGSLELDMAALTGESAPVVRSAEALAPAASVLDAEDLVFAGTLCTAGEARAVVYATAMARPSGGSPPSRSGCTRRSARCSARSTALPG